MTISVGDPRPSLTLYKGRLHHWQPLVGAAFTGILREFVEGPGNAVFEIELNQGNGQQMRWVTLNGLAWWELLDDLDGPTKTPASPSRLGSDLPRDPGSEAPRSASERTRTVNPHETGQGVVV